MDNSLRNWVASTLLNGYKAGQLQQVLVKAGFSPEEVKKELELAAPYIDVANKINKRLHAREGLLKTLDRQMREQPYYLKPQKVKLPPFKQFLEEYYYPNRVGFFSGAIDDREVRNWTPRGLIDKVGADTVVEMQYEYSTQSEARYQLNAEAYQKSIRFGDFIDMLEASDGGKNFYVAGGNYSANSVALKALRKDIEDIGDGFLREESNEQRMYYLIGPKGTVTPVHYDFVNNMFIQVYGRKLVRLIPSMQVPYVYHNARTHSEVDFLNLKPSLHPDFASATVIEIEVGPGDCVFIPIGWWHHVTSLSISISLACTNINVPPDQNTFIDSNYIMDETPAV